MMFLSCVWMRATHRLAHWLGNNNVRLIEVGPNHALKLKCVTCEKEYWI